MMQCLNVMNLKHVLIQSTITWLQNIEIIKVKVMIELYIWIFVIIHLCVHTLNGMTLRRIRNTVYMMVRIIWVKI
ncbi:hypothetical protein MA05_05495 [Comamonas aquatica]|nr:hypothetical protein MA05_05495 [Comamonas aquatica]